MEDFGEGPRFDSMTTAVRRKRSYTFRRPRPDSQPYTETNDESPMSSNPASDDVYKASSDENGGCDMNSNRKEFSLNQCISRASSSSGLEGERPYKRDRKDGGANSHQSNEPARSGSIGKRLSEGVLAPSHWKNSSTVNDSVETESRSEEGVGGLNGESPSSRQSGLPADGFGSDSRVKKVKLRVCGVTRTIEANSVSNGESSAKSARHPDASRHRPKNSVEGNLEDHITSSDRKAGLQGIPWKDFSRGGISLGKDDSVMGKGRSTSGKEADKSEPVRKSKRVPKRRVLDDEFGDDEEDDEIRYLEKLKNSRVSAGNREDDEEPKKHRKLSVVSNIENGGGSRSAKEGKKKPGADTRSGDADYEEEDESPSDGDLVGKNKKKKQPGKEPIDSPTDGKREITLTTRQRALQSSKDTTSTPGASLIEFPNGLPPAPSRRQKEKLTDVEQQLKKAEAAQRRKLQVEKAARESEAEAIKKILGQDSSRKKREDKNKKRQEELAQSKAAVALLNASSTVRVVMGPTGTVVTFPEEMGLPSIFNSKPHSYPPPRENCAGPLCTNPYKYRDSKSKLPLCSLQCYKAVQGKPQSETTC